MTPYRKAHILTEYEDGLVTLAYPRFSRPWMQKYLRPKGLSTHIRVRLEEHGSAVWELIDGARTVREIVEALATHFEAHEQHEERVVAYVMQLHKDGFVGYAHKASQSNKR